METQQPPAWTKLFDVSIESAVHALAEELDSANDAADEKRLTAGIEAGEKLLGAATGTALEPELHYLIGNGWAALRGARFLRAGGTGLPWEQPELRKQLLSFRRAMTSSQNVCLDLYRRCQILNNLGNALNHVGRFVEALAYYRQALALDPNFGMAVASEGHCLLHYAEYCHDDGHRRVIARAAKDCLERALCMPLEHDTPVKIKKDLRRAASMAGKSVKHWDRRYSPCWSRSRKERRFREWALEHGLFINPLNDLGAQALASCDVLHLPSMAMHEAGTGFHGFYNQLKQEFAMARLNLFKAVSVPPSRHFADEDLGLLDTRNGTVFGARTERLKLAFRSAYSLMDKVAVFVAYYYSLKVKPRDVGIRTVWYEKNALRTEFSSADNWPLQGLFWLAQDLHDKDVEFYEALEPDAKAIAKIRNQLEHQYARIVEPGTHSSAPFPEDSIGYTIAKEDLEAKTWKVIRLARAALIYLAFSVHASERRKPQLAGAVPLTMDTLYPR